MKRSTALFVALLTASCALADDKPIQQSQQNQGQSRQQMSAEQQYLAHQASFCAFQIEAAKLAQQQSQDQQIKQYATDSQKSAQEQWASIQQTPQWSQIAAIQQPQQQGEATARLAASTDQQKIMLPTQQAMLSELQQAKGADFDRLYAFQQSAIQQYSKLENRWAAKNAQQQQVKNFAQKQSEIYQQSKINEIAESIASK